MSSHLMLHWLRISAAQKRPGRCPHRLLFLPLPRIKVVHPPQSAEQKISRQLGHFHSTDCRCRGHSEKGIIILLLSCGSRNWQSPPPCLSRITPRRGKHEPKSGSCPRLRFESCTGLRRRSCRALPRLGAPAAHTMLPAEHPKGQSKDIFNWGQESPKGKKNPLKTRQQTRDFLALFS